MHNIETGTYEIQCSSKHGEVLGVEENYQVVMSGMSGLWKEENSHG